MSEIILQTRLSRPKTPDKVIHRVRLTQLLKENINKNLILLCSAAGYGKTTLISDFLSEQKNKYAWIYVGKEINSYYTFFTYITQSLIKINRSFGNKTLILINSLKENKEISHNYKVRINDIASTFLNEFIESFNEKVILVFDDLHNIENDSKEWLNYLMDYLFENLPENLKIIITTREMPEFNTSKLMAKRRLLLLGTKELQLDKNEEKELIEEIYSIPYKEENLFNNYFNGWVTGLHLIMQSHINKPDKIKINIDPGSVNETVFEYFANDIFINLNTDVQSFLLNTSLLDTFDYKICNFALSITNSKEIIKSLLEKNIFIEQAERIEKKESEAFRLNELFRVFLQSKFEESQNEVELKRFLDKLFEYFLLNKDFINAVTYALKGKKYDKALPLIEQHMNHLLDSGNYETLWKWFSTIPDEKVKIRPKLLYGLASVSLYYNSSPELCIKYLKSAVEIYGKTVIDEFYIDCVLLKSNAYYITGDSEEIVSELNHILSILKNPLEKAKVLFSLARFYYKKGFDQFNNSAKMLEEALEICTEHDFNGLKPAIFRQLAHIYLDWGELLKGIYYYEQALNIKTDVYYNFNSILGLVDSYSYTGNYFKAKECLDKAAVIFKSFPAGMFKRSLIKATGSFYFEFGEYEESIRKYIEVNEIEVNNKVFDFAPMNYFLIGGSFDFLNEAEKAKISYFKAKSYFGKDNEYMNKLYLFLESKLKARNSVNAEIEKNYLDFLKYYEDNSLIQSVVQLQFHLADYYLKSGQNETANKYLKECLKTASEKQYISFLENEVFPCRHVFDFAIENNIQKKFVETIIENVRNKLSYDWLSAECKKRLTVQIQTLTDLTLNSFGRTELFLRGDQIPEEKWIRKKSKIILCYLLAKPGNILNKDNIIDIFLQDIPSDKVDTIYHNTLSNIRNAIKVEYLKDFEIKGKSTKSNFEIIPQFLIYEDKSLKLNSDYSYKSDNAEFEDLYNTSMGAGVKLDKKIACSRQAINLYKGEFMPGYYNTWCEEMRQDYSAKYQKLCEDLIEIYSQKELYEDVIIYSHKLIDTDKLHSDAYLRMIESYTKLGKVNMAKDKFAMMLKHYDEELGEKPEKNVLNRINEILV